MIIFVSTKQVTGKSGQALQVVTFAEVKKKNEKIVYTPRDFYVDPEEDYAALSYGDVLEVTFGEPDTFGGYPPLDTVKRVAPSVFADLL